MPLYYPELDDDFSQIPSKEFSSDYEAIEYFFQRYGKSLLVIVRDCDPDIEVIYERV